MGIEVLSGERGYDRSKTFWPGSRPLKRRRRPERGKGRAWRQSWQRRSRAECDRQRDGHRRRDSALRAPSGWARRAVPRRRRRPSSRRRVLPRADLRVPPPCRRLDRARVPRHGGAARRRRSSSGSTSASRAGSRASARTAGRMRPGSGPELAGGYVIPVALGLIGLVMVDPAQVADRGVRAVRRRRRVRDVPRDDALRRAAPARGRAARVASRRRELPVRSHGRVDRALLRARAPPHVPVRARAVARADLGDRARDPPIVALSRIYRGCTTRSTRSPASRSASRRSSSWSSPAGSPAPRSARRETAEAR